MFFEKQHSYQYCIC